MPDSKRRAFIDPGLGGTGVAIYDGEVLIHTFPVTGEKEESWHQNINYIANSLHAVLESSACEEVYYELPAYMVNAGKTNQSGDFVKLCMVTGAIQCMQYGTIQKIQPVTIASWKGNTPKPLMASRIKEKCDKYGFILRPKITTHEIDAIGIGMYVLGLMK